MTKPIDPMKDPLAYALRSNEKLQSDAGLRKLADEAARRTNGQVYFQYTTVPSTTAYYVFSPYAERWNHATAVLRLTAIIGTGEA